MISSDFLYFFIMDCFVIPSLLDLSVTSITQGLCPPCEDLAPLPPHLKDSLRVVFVKRGRLTALQLKSLLHPRVRRVDLSDCIITDDHASALTACKGLMQINLNQVNKRSSLQKHRGTIMSATPSQEALQDLFSTARFLKVAYLRGLSGVTDSVVATLSRSSRHLAHLDLGGCGHVGDQGVSSLADNCPALTSLSLARTKVSDVGLADLSQAECRGRLQELRIDSCFNVSDDGVELLLDGLNTLQILIFHGCPGVTERTRLSLEAYLAMNGRAVKQLTWTVY